MLFSITSIKQQIIIIINPSWPKNHSSLSTPRVEREEFSDLYDKIATTNER